MKILVFPEDNKNPYQFLLYKAMRSSGVEIGYLGSLTWSASLNVLFRPFQIIWFRIKGYSILHIHWTNIFVPGMSLWRLSFFNYIAYLFYIICLLMIKLCRYKLIWTAHNILPHEPVFIGSRELKARKWIIKMADLVIVHSESTIDDMANLGLYPRKWISIPHGSYIGVYPNSVGRKRARGKFNFPDNAFVYLFLGQIRDYKGVDLLLDAYARIQNVNTRLIIAGMCSDLRLRAKLKQSQSEFILWNDGLVSDVGMQNYFAAANIVVLPFKKVTTSGSALLALSFGKSVIVPAIGDLEKLPSNLSYKYDSNKKEGLEQMMSKVLSEADKTDKKGLAAFEYANKLKWSDIAKKTLKEFSKL